jgi:hypothetical protein
MLPVEDELAEAPALQVISSARIKGEKFPPWLERKPIQLTILSYSSHFDWRNYPNCSNHLW